MGKLKLLWRSSLNFRFMVGILGLFLALYASVAAYNYFAIKSGSYNAWKKALASQVKFIANSISSSLEARRNMVQLLARDPATRNLILRGRAIESQILHRYRAIFHTDPDIAGIYILSPSGELLFQYGIELKESLKNREFFTMAVKGLTWMSPTSLDAKTPCIYYSSPILDENGGVRAVLVLRYFARGFVSRAISAKREALEAFRITVYDSRGVCIADSEDSSILLTSVRPIEQEAMKEIIEKEIYGSDIKFIRFLGPKKIWEVISKEMPLSNPFRYDGPKGSYLAIISQVGPQRWYVMVSIPLHLIMSPMTRSLIGSTIFSAVILIIGFLVALYLARTVIIPLRFLRDATVRLSEWDSSVPLPIEREDELGELAKSFYTMRSNLISSHRELSERKEELEAINQIASIANRSLNEEEIARGSLDKMVELLGARCGIIYILNHRPGSVRLWISNPVDMISSEELIEIPEIERSALEDISIFLSKEISKISFLAPFRNQHVFSVVGIPLKAKEGPIGLALIGFGKESRTTNLSRKSGLFRAIGDVVGMALENAILHMESIRHAEIIGLRNRIANIVTGSLSVEEICSKFVNELYIAFDFQGIILGIVKEGVIKVMAISPQEELKAIAGKEWPMDRIALERILREKPHVMDKDELFFCPQLRDALEGCGLYNYAFPVISKEKFLGILAICGDKRFEVDVISPMVDHLAVALENALLYEETQKLAISDELTGLYNRRYFFSSLEAELVRARRYGYPISLLFLDIDFFKRYNDRYGHIVGDQLLRELGILLRKEIRAVDIPSRYGGEEFAIILPMTQKSGAISVAERIRKKVMETPFCIGLIPSGTSVTISVGISAFPEDGKDTDALVMNADNALYKAKEMGRNRVEIAGSQD